MVDLQNSNLRTLAIVEAQMTKGLERPSEYLIPFFQSAIGKRAGTPFIIKEILIQIEQDYAIEIPFYMAESIMPTLERIGAIAKDTNLNCHLCIETSEHDIDVELDQQHFNLLGDRLNRFAKSHDFDTPIASTNWQKALINFFSNKESENKAGKLKGKLMLNPKEKDDWLISKFIFEMETLEPAVFELIKRIFAAYSIADTISSIQHTGHTDDWQGLNVVYDSAVLMRLLGTSGKFLQKATYELHNLLLDIGCNTFYFDTNLNEIFQNLEALTARHLSGSSLHRETAQALENGEITIGEINLLKGSADTLLGKLNITQLDLLPRTSNIKAQINPLDLESFLKANINYRRNTYAAQVDAESIERIIFLRNEKKYSELPKSKYIFVTHNTKYAKYSSVYCKKNCGYKDLHVPPIVTLSTLTSLSWLASENGGKPLDMSNELIINCFQASLPDDKWFGKFWHAIENCKPELLDINAHDSLYLLDVRKAAEEISMGSSALLDDVDISMVIESAVKSAEEKELKFESAIKEEQLAAKKSLQNHIEEKQELQKQAQLDKENALNQAAEEKEKMRLQLEIASNTKIDTVVTELEEEHLNKIAQTIKDKEKVTFLKIEIKAKKHARTVSRILTLTIVALLCYIFYLSQQATLPTWVSADYANHIQVTSVLLGIIQIIGLFIPQCSFLFLGPKIELFCSSYFEKYYRSLIE